MKTDGQAANCEAVAVGMLNVHLLELRSALWETPNRYEPGVPGPEWERLWDRVRTEGARLVVIDPVAATVDVSLNDVGAVRRFIRAVRNEAEKAGCGVLLVAHSNKAAGITARARGGPGKPR